MTHAMGEYRVILSAVEFVVIGARSRDEAIGLAWDKRGIDVDNISWTIEECEKLS